MALTDQDVGEILIEQSYISEEELAAGLEQAKERDASLLSTLIDQGLLTMQLFEGALAEHFQLEFFDLPSNPPTPEAVLMLPEEVARRYNVLVIAGDKKSVTVATADPSEENLEEIIRMNIGREEAVFPEEPSEDDGKKKKKKSSSGMTLFSKQKKDTHEEFKGKIGFVYATKSSITASFTHYRKPLETRFQKIIEGQDKVAPEILVEILNDAIQLRASDIHFEPQEKIVIVRFRVDGVMHEAGRIPKEYYEGVVNRVKIDSNMRIDEHFAAQDGAIRHKTSSGTIDIRVSIVPVVDGEKIVMRILAEYVRHLTLTDLGFSEHYQEVLHNAAHKPFGMILTTGPTGSGKSTTLYALLKMRNSPDVNISTIEDPVEYKIGGINHIQVNEKTNLTFANGLRALVRQDPDVILVGEIRDGETAEISVQAALTGHLLFSTLHANDAATAIPRLQEMGLESFLLASTVEVIIGQRLVRRICPQCRYSYYVSADETRDLFPGASEFFPKGQSATLYKGKGCDACGNTGYRGRVGIYELLEIVPEIEELIIANATSTDINEKARELGMKLLFEDGFEKVKAGMTTIEELMRVAAPPDVVMGDAAEHTREELNKKKEVKKAEKKKAESKKKEVSDPVPKAAPEITEEKVEEATSEKPKKSSGKKAAPKKVQKKKVTPKKKTTSKKVAAKPKKETKKAEKKKVATKPKTPKKASKKSDSSPSSNPFTTKKV